MKEITRLAQFNTGSFYYIKDYGKSDSRNYVFKCKALHLMSNYVEIQRDLNHVPYWFYNHHLKDFNVFEINKEENPEYFL